MQDEKCKNCFHAQHDGRVCMVAILSGSQGDTTKEACGCEEYTEQMPSEIVTVDSNGVVRVR